MRALPVAVLLSVVLAGCVGAPGARTESPASATAEEPVTATPSPTPCEVDERPDPKQTVNAVKGSEYPDLPATFSNESVEAYVESFEGAFLRNDALAGAENVTYLEVYVSAVEVANVTQSGAYVVHVKSYTNGGYLDDSGSGTPIQVHWDGAPQRVSYYVTENEIRRTEGSVGGDWPSTGMLRHGQTVACPGS